MRFNFRINDFEARSCNEHLMNTGVHNSFEIVKWFKDEQCEDICYAVAYTRDTKDSYEIILIPDRIKDIPAEILVDLLLKACQEKNKLLKEYL